MKVSGYRPENRSFVHVIGKADREQVSAPFPLFWRNVVRTVRVLKEALEAFPAFAKIRVHIFCLIF